MNENFFEKIWNSIKEGFLKLADNADVIIIKILIIIAIIVVAKLVIVISNKIIKRILDSKRKKSSAKEINRRLETLYTLFKSIVRYTVYFFAIATILGELGLGITAGSILATAGIGGIAIGLGAQALVKDVVAGAFFMFESQFKVGDIIEAAGVKGTVEEITLRTTNIRAYTGELFIVPNGQMEKITNYNRGNSLFGVTVAILNALDIEKTMDIMKNEFLKYAATEDGRVLLDEPKVLGVISVDSDGIKIRTVQHSQALQYFDAERELTKNIYMELTRQGIEIPVKKHIVIKKE